MPETAKPVRPLRGEIGKLAKSRANKGNADMTKTKTSSPAPAMIESPAAPVAATAKIEPAKGNMFSDYSRTVAKDIAAKADLLSLAKQRLAHAADLFADGRAKNGEAAEVANTGALPIYQGRIAGLFSNAEVSAVLGDIFGYKPKSNGEPGKTPAGEGEALRKRIVRAVAAYEYSTGQDDGGKFFAGLPADEIGQVCRELDRGHISLFTAYERFADIRKEHTARTEQAFNPKHIESLCDSLAKLDAASIIKGNPELLSAYAALAALIEAIGEAGALIED